MDKKYDVSFFNKQVGGMVSVDKSLECEKSETPDDALVLENGTGVDSCSHASVVVSSFLNRSLKVQGLNWIFCFCGSFKEYDDQKLLSNSVFCG